MRVVLFGAPGSGKGTQARLIVEKYGIPEIAVGELLREAMAAGTPSGIQARSLLDNGNPVSDELMANIIRERLSRPDASKGFTLDGYPENIAQAQALDILLQSMGRPLHLALLLETDFDALMQRITGRRACSSCGHVHNIFTDPPKMDGQCDLCGGNLRHRADDNEEIISNRYRVYESQIMPVIDYYKQQGRLRVVQGIGEAEDIFAAISQLLDSIEDDDEEIMMPTVEALEQMILSKAQEAQVEERPASESKPAPKKKVTAKKKVAAKKSKTTAKTGKKTPQKKVPVKKAGSAAKKKTTTKKTSGKVAKKKTAVKKKTTTKAPAKKKTVAKKTAAKKKTSTARKKPTSKKVAVKKTVKKKVAAKKSVTKKSVARKKAPVKKKAASKKKKR